MQTVKNVFIMFLVSLLTAGGIALYVKDLITSATGEPLNANYFKSHLQNRYLI